jgi:hypothetical protein
MMTYDFRFTCIDESGDYGIANLNPDHAVFVLTLRFSRYSQLVASVLILKSASF